VGGVDGIGVNADVEMRGREAVPRADQFEGGAVVDGQVGIAQGRGLHGGHSVSSRTQYALGDDGNVSSRTIGQRRPARSGGVCSHHHRRFKNRLAGNKKASVA